MDPWTIVGEEYTGKKMLGDIIYISLHEKIMYTHKIKCFFTLGAETLRSKFSNFVPMNDNISKEESTEIFYNFDAEEESSSSLQIQSP